MNMNMKGRIAVSALAIWAFAACQSGPRTVENPLIETSNRDVQHQNP